MQKLSNEFSYFSKLNTKKRLINTEHINSTSHTCWHMTNTKKRNCPCFPHTKFVWGNISTNANICTYKNESPICNFDRLLPNTRKRRFLTRFLSGQITHDVPFEFKKCKYRNRPSETCIPLFRSLNCRWVIFLEFIHKYIEYSIYEIVEFIRLNLFISLYIKKILF